MAYRNLHNHVRLVSIELLQLFGRAARPSAKANNADNDIPVNKSMELRMLGEGIYIIYH